MLKYRRLLWLTSGQQPAQAWLEAVEQEVPVSGKPHGCAPCPLRLGGEWEEGAAAALAGMTQQQRSRCAKRWGCHEGNRPCAGMVRLAGTAP